MIAPPWKIEKTVFSGKYIYAKVPDHPNRTSTGYVYLHRILYDGTAKADDCLD